MIDNEDKIKENDNNDIEGIQEKFKVGNEEITESDSNTIIDFDDEEEEEGIVQKDEDEEENDEVHHKEEPEEENENEEEQNDENNEQEDDNMDDEENNEISDSNVKKLMAMDLENDNKEDIINILMKDNIVKKNPVKPEEIIKLKNKTKFQNIESTINKNIEGNLKTTYGRSGFLINAKEGDPQFIRDMQKAVCFVKGNIENENMEVAKILFDEDTIEERKLKTVSRRHIDQKIKDAIERKKKNLEKIEAKIYEEQKQEATFKPEINVDKNVPVGRRKLDKFLEDQINYKKKVEDKIKELAQKKEDQINNQYIGRPKVDKASEEMAKKMVTAQEPAFMRLYNKSLQEKTKQEEVEKLKKEREKEENLKKKEKEKTKNPYAHIKSKIECTRKKKIPENEEENKKGGKQEKSQEEKKEEESKKSKKKLLALKDIYSNKILLNNFNQKFEDSCQQLASEVESNNNENESKQNETLDEFHFNKLLYNLGMISHIPEKEKPKKENVKENNDEEQENENENENEEEFNGEIPVESIHKKQEKKLSLKIFNTLKDQNNEVNKETLKEFLGCIVGIQPYDFYRQYKNKHEHELKNIFPEKDFNKEDIPELMILKNNEELLSTANPGAPKNNKYVFKTADNKIKISLEKGNNIKKDFYMFGLNYRNAHSTDKANKASEIQNDYNAKCTFKPKINDNSEKLFQKMKEKSNPQEIETVTTNSKKNNEHMDYIDRILLHDKKKIAETQKVKEELEKKMMKECTFKPQLNENATKIKSKTGNRIEELYNKGKDDIKARKQRAKMIFEDEEDKKECTFQPKLISADLGIPETRFNNDIYNEKEYKELYERLKKGRIERQLKESAVGRFDLNNELKTYIKNSKKPKNKNVNEPEEEIEDNNYAENEQPLAETANSKNQKPIKGFGPNSSTKKEKKNENKAVNEEEIYNNNQPEEEFEDPDKKEGIPLLIIDVNIRQGVKKKIYVYEGDTPEALADKFAKEHHLEKETQDKLQNLIHSHMLRLLTRIDEENQSISEKSQATHPNNKNSN